MTDEAQQSRVLSPEQFDRVVSTLRLIPISAAPHFPYLSKQFSVNENALRSIYSNDVSAHVNKATVAVRASAPSLAARYIGGEDILELSWSLNLPPCSILRRILEVLPLGLAPKGRITAIFRDPESLPSLVSPQIAATAIRGQGTNGKYSPDEPSIAPSDLKAGEAFLSRLMVDVQRCVTCDHVCGPGSDAARHSAGVEYERRLCAALDAHGIAYHTEDDLRDGGHFKTPDVRLLVPISVGGHLVKWIDSKATFGDEQQHRGHVANQFQTYIHRYGPGLVIYWHGYVKSAEEVEEEVLVMDRFPIREELTTLPRLALDI